MPQETNTRSNTDRLRRAIRALAGDENAELYSIVAKVVSVDTAEKTCEVAPIDGTANISDVRLAPDGAVEPGILPVPAVDSVVIVDMINDSDGYVAMYSAVDSLIIRTTSGNILQLQDGSLGGIPIVSNLTSRLNAIEQDINQLKSIFSAWTPAPNDGGAALKAALGGYPGSSLDETEDSDIENDKVTHGV